MALARRMWEAVERLHGLCYSAPEPPETGTAAGLKGFWMNYFATRAAPMGAVSPAVVEATFFYYAPKRVQRAIPDAWSFSSPDAVLAARYDGMTAALESVLGSPDASEATDLVRAAVEGCDGIGKPLFAGWASLDWPTHPLAALWHGCTILREHRSGAHLIALASAGLDGCQSVVSQVAIDDGPRAWIRDEAGWSEGDETAALESLKERGWVDATGAATAAGRAGRAEIERLTDELDSPHWHAFGDARCDRLVELLEPLNAALPPDDQLDWREIYSK